MLVSKALSFGILAGACIVQLPVIKNMVAAKSAVGVTMAPHLLQLFTLSTTCAYNLAQGNPFSTWGESAFLLVQMAVIVALILRYTGHATHVPVYALALVVACAGLVTVVPMPLLVQLYGATIPVNVASRSLQIADIFSLGGTGQLSGITLAMNFAGVFVRVFTTLQEVDDRLVLAGFLAALACNTILLAQFVFYAIVRSTKIPAPTASKKTAVSESKKEK